MSAGWERLTNGDLGVYRVVFAATMLLMLPDFRWVSSFPDSLYRPPPGPMQVLGGFPPAWFMLALEVGIAVSLACLLVGRVVRTASWALAGMLVIGYGLHNSLGKIDHSILILLTPVALVLAGWAPHARFRPWVMRLWAFTIGIGMMTAAIPKLSADWLDIDTHAVRGILTNQILAFEEDAWLSGLAMRMSSPLVWEPVDWVAPLLEASVVVCAMVGLRMFRRVLAILMTFHLGIGLTLNIWFAGNVIAYGAFVGWSNITWVVGASRAVTRAPWWTVGPLALAAVMFSRLDVQLQGVVVIVGIAVTVQQVWRAVHDRAGGDVEQPQPVAP